MSEFDIKLDHETVCDITQKFLTYCLDADHVPEERAAEFRAACQEVLHFIMVPQEWEKRYSIDFLEYIGDDSKVNNEFWEHYCHRENETIGTLKGEECNWCGMTEEVIRQNKENQERVNKYMEWRADER